ncbi:MAG: hypothetical protein QNJ72_23890 [Pleurocapsa sp. MO_226.B13]|nr:hypothetical protein [Pleurocapsa sp. MO_226.B13]
MNSNEIKNRASSFFERLKVYGAFLVRYIVFICRKYPLIAVIFLVFYAFFLYRFLSPNFSISSNKNLPIPQQQTLPNSQTANPNTNNLPSTTPSPVVPAQVTAVHSGSKLSIKWTESIEDPLIYSERGLIDSNCISRSCSINLSEPISQIEVYWRQGGKRYVKNFKVDKTVTSNTASQEELREQAVAKLEEKHQQLKQKRLSAAQEVFAKGKVFEGTISYREESQPIKIAISDLVANSYIVEISNPVKETTQIFEGEITEVFKGENYRFNFPEYSPEKASAFLSLKSRSPQSDLPDDAWRFYKEEVILLLDSTDLGVDGVAESINYNGISGWDYKITLR